MRISPGVEDEVEAGIGLWPVQVQFEIVTDKDESTPESLHNIAVSRLSVGMFDPAAVAGLTAGALDFTCYDIIPQGAPELEVEDRKWKNGLAFNVLVMMKNI